MNPCHPPTIAMRIEKTPAPAIIGHIQIIHRIIPNLYKYSIHMMSSDHISTHHNYFRCKHILLSGYSY
jgi:hypothetical protein